MGGGGAMSMANSGLKYNRSLIGKRKFKETKGLLIKKSGKTKLEFKQVSSLELAKIKTQIRQEARKRTKRLTIAYIIVVVIFLSFIAYWFELFI